jgi:hypothetical protein
MRQDKNRFILALLLAAFGCDSTPEVAIDTPAPADTVAEAVTITLTATDNDSVTFVELWVDGDSTGLTDDSEPFSFRWNTVDHGNISAHNLVAYAVDIDGNRGKSDTIVVTVDNRQSYPEPKSVDSTAFMNSRYTLNWVLAADNDFASYRIEKSDDPKMAEAQVITTSENRNTTTFTDSNMDPLQHHYYRIVVIDTLGFESPGSIHRSDLYPPPLPANVTAVTYDYDAMTVEWTPSNGENFEQYTLFTASSEVGSRRAVATYDDPMVTTHILDNFDPTRENWFWVVTRNIYDQTTQGEGITHTPDPPPVTLAVTSVKYNLKKMVINWEKTPDDDFRVYELLHSETEDGIRTLVATVENPEITSHTLIDFDPTHENWFWIRVTDHWRLRSIGNAMTHETDKSPKPIAVRSVSYDLEKMTVKWQRSREQDFLAYEVLHSDSEMGEKQLLEIITNPKTTTYRWKDFDPTHENWFWVRVTDHWGLTYKGSGKTHEIDPPPVSVDVDSVWYNEQIMTVTWGISKEADFAYYELFTSDTEYGNRRPVVKIGDINRTNYVFRHFDPTKENWFTVDVVDKWGLRSTGRARTNEANEPPEPIRITSVNYNFEQFNITWRKTAQTDFSFYDLLVSTERDGKQKRLVTLTSVKDTAYTINGRGVFDPTREHWFWIRTGDSWGQEVTGPGYRVLDDPPLMSYLHPVEYRKNRFIFTWATNDENDFSRYNLYESAKPEMLDESIIFTTVDRIDTTFVLKGIDPWEARYYRLEVEDVWGLRTTGEVRKGDSESWFIATHGDVHHEEGRSVQETADGGFIVAGHAYANEDNGDIWLVKTDPKGNIDWTQIYGGDGDDHAYSVQVTADGGYVVAGFSEAIAEKWSDAWVIKTDSEGRVEWNRTYGGFRWDKAHHIRQTTDGGYIITGYTFSRGSDNADIWLIKADVNGYPVWTNTFGGPDWEYGYAVQETADGGFIISGFTETEEKKSSRIWLVKTDSQGQEQWTRTFGSRKHNTGHFVQETADGGYIVVGITQSFFPNFEDVLLIKTDATGKTLWEKTFGGQSWDRCHTVRQTDDGGYILAGSSRLKEESNADAWLLKTNAVGNPLWQQTFESISSDEVTSLQITSDGGFVLAGSSASMDGSPADLLLIKTDARGTTPSRPEETLQRLGAVLEKE